MQTNAMTATCGLLNTVAHPALCDSNWTSIPHPLIESGHTGGG